VRVLTLLSRLSPAPYSDGDPCPRRFSGDPQGYLATMTEPESSTSPVGDIPEATLEPGPAPEVPSGTEVIADYVPDEDIGDSSEMSLMDPVAIVRRESYGRGAIPGS
jgi:hypothetical protein